MVNKIRISTSPWAVLKDTETQAEEGQMSPQVVQSEHNRLFSPTRSSSQVWYTDTTDANGQTGETSVANYLQNKASEKLTVFWDNIKTEL